MTSIDIPNGVISIGIFAFSNCTSLISVRIPNSVTIIRYEAFCHCSSLRSIHVPNTVTNIEYQGFGDCNKMEQRQTNGTNYDTNINTWLRQRFDNLPIHHACYYANDSESALHLLSNLIRNNEQTLAATDAMGMTPLHILCCNLRATVEMVQVIVENDPSLLTRTDVTECTPLQLFLKCRRPPGGTTCSRQQQEKIPTSFRNLLDMGISGEDVAILLILNDNPEFLMSLRSKDDSTNLFPFMTAATLSYCGLDVVHNLAMKSLDVIV